MFNLNQHGPIDAEVKRILNDVKERWASFTDQTFHSESDDGNIQVTVGSSGDIREVSIHILAKRRHDNLTLSELVLDAVQHAQSSASAERNRLMRQGEILGVPVQEFMDNPTAALPHFEWQPR